MLLGFSLFLLLYRFSTLRLIQCSRSEPIPLYMDELLDAGRRVYDNQSPPIQDDEDKVTKVKLAMYIEGMSSFRTQTMDFQLDVYFQQFWKDPRLAHNETRRILIRDKKILHKMWHPDVYFANARTAEFHEVTQPNFLVWIEPDGSILFDTRISMVVVCTLNLEKWPLDSQRCELRILSYAYTTSQLIIEWIEDTPITRNPGIAMSDMHIVDLYPGTCDGNYSTGTWSCVTAQFYVKREITHHVMQSYVPTTLIVVISWFSFWLDVEAVPARVSLAITTLLTLSTQSNAARMALPEVSYMKAIDVWMGACMMFVFGVMIEFTIVNYAQRQGRKWHRSDAEIVMASSLESVAEKKRSEQLSHRARDIIDRLKGKDHQQLVEDECIRLNGIPFDTISNAYSNSYSDDEQNPHQTSQRRKVTVVSDTGDIPKIEIWRNKEAETAERLANWATFDERPSSAKHRGSVWSRLIPNGQDKSPTHSNYGSTTRSQNGEVRPDKWSSAIKQIQKHKPRRSSIWYSLKKMAGRNRAKRIDQKSRWMFPLTFIIFNITYWFYYLIWKE
ncbi:unnamed protein product [Auanema sp. JU1783]|nr:unnamed protein product [Auanema sp. JU1783]